MGRQFQKIGGGFCRPGASYRFRRPRASPVATLRTFSERGGTVQIVAVRTLHEPFVYAMVEGLGELCPGRGVAVVAQLRLAPGKQAMLFLRMMRRVTVEAADIIAGMRRAVEVRLPLAVSMTAQATGTRQLTREFLEANDLAEFARPSHMFTTRPVTGFAPVATL